MTAATPIVTPLPAGYQLRAPRLEDVDEVVALMNACDVDAGGPGSWDRETVLGQWQDPLRTLEDEDWLIVAPGGAIVAFLELYEYPPYTTFEFEGYVHPGHQGRGLGSALLAIIEARARRELHRAPSDQPVVLRTSIWSANDAAAALLAARDFSHVRDWRRMQLDFDGPLPTPRWPDGIRPRAFVPGQDERAVWEAHEAAFADHWGSAPLPFEEFLYYRIESEASFDPSLWLLAEDTASGELAGFALAKTGDARLPDGGWVALLGTRGAYRGRGIGLAMLHEVFGELRGRGCRGVGLDVDGASLTGADRLYERAGMREVRRKHHYDKQLR